MHKKYIFLKLLPFFTVQYRTIGSIVLDCYKKKQKMHIEINLYFNTTLGITRKKSVQQMKPTLRLINVSYSQHCGPPL